MIIQNLCGRARSNYLAPLKDVAVIGNIFDQIEVMGGKPLSKPS